MKYKSLADFMYQKEREFEEAIIAEGRKLSLVDITSGFKFDAHQFADDPKNYNRWEDGDEIKQNSYPYTLIVTKHTLTLRGIHDIQLAEFRGEEVQAYYEQLSERILKAKEDINVPF